MSFLDKILGREPQEEPTLAELTKDQPPITEADVEKYKVTQNVDEGTPADFGVEGGEMAVEEITVENIPVPANTDDAFTDSSLAHNDRKAVQKRERSA